MRKLDINYPESILSTLNISHETFEEEARFALAVKLFELGRITSGQAALLAGIPRVLFLLNCHKYGTASVNWDMDELDLEFGEQSS